MHFLLALALSLSLATPFKAIAHLFRPPATVTDRVSASVLRITGEAEDMFGGAVRYTCTGFAIAPKQVMTAAHCVGTHMQADGSNVLPIWADKYFDLAVLADEKLTKPALELREAPVDRFEALTAIGYGYGWTRLTVLQERVILVNYAVVGDAAKGLVVQGGYIGGMSGGPVVDADGKVVSVVQRGNAQIGYGVGTLLMRAFLLDAEMREPTNVPVKTNDSLGVLAPMPALQ